jgi:hypothetical protein
MILDEAGWSELSKLLGETLEQAMKISEESASRLANEGSEGIPTSLSLLNFEVPPKAAK